MNQFSPSDAALEGFRLTRERPGTILAWSALYALGISLIAVVMMASLSHDFINLAKTGQLASQDPEVVAGMLEKSWPAFLLVLALTILLLSIVMAGIYRLVLRPGERGFIHLRLGKDELRLWAVNLLLFVLGMLCLTIGFVAVAAAQQISPLLEFAVTLAVICVPVWIGVRLSLATPMTFALQKIDLREAWRLTHGKFWPMLGMMVLTVIFYIMVWVLVAIIVFAVVQLAGGEHAIEDIGHLPVLAAVGAVVSLLLQLILQILQVVMIYAPFAVAYQQLHGDAPANPLRLWAHNG